MRIDPGSFEPVLFDQIQKHGAIVDIFPKFDLNREPLVRLAVGIVGLGVLALGIWLAFGVRVSDNDDEQRPFVYAMFGVVFLGAVCALLGFGDWLRRTLVNPASIDRWCVVLQRALLVLDQGRVAFERPLDDLLVRTGQSSSDPISLVDAELRPVPLEDLSSIAVTELVQRMQREASVAKAANPPLARQGSRDAVKTPGEPGQPCKLPFVYAWRAGVWRLDTWFEEGKVVRVYRDQDAVLIVHAGAFAPARLGLSVDYNARGMLGAVVRSASESMANSDFDARRAVLDAMTLEEIRNEAIANTGSARVDAASVSEARVDPPASNFWERLWSNDEETHATGGRFRFTRGTRPWRIALFRLDDTVFAIEAFGAAIGAERLLVSPALRLNSPGAGRRS